jgi:hypothetical protein
VKRASFTVAAIAALFALAPAAPIQAATRPAARLYLAPASLRPGDTFAIIATCPQPRANPVVTTALMSGTIELDNAVSPAFALFDVAHHARPRRYPFTLRCLSGHRASTAHAALRVLGSRRTWKASSRKKVVIQAGYGGMALEVASHSPGG